MTKRALTPLALMLLMMLSPAALLADHHAAGEKLLGKWDMTSVSFGEDVEEMEPGVFAVEFLADGTMKSWEGGEEDSGTYKIEGDNITFYEDGDEEGETFKFTATDDAMTISQGDENFKMTVTLARVAQ